MIQNQRVRFVRASAPVCLVRSPNSANANNVRDVNSDGSLNNNNAYNGNRGVRPLRWIIRQSRPQAENTIPPSKESVSLPCYPQQG